MKRPRWNFVEPRPEPKPRYATHRPMNHWKETFIPFMAMWLFIMAVTIWTI